MKPKISLLVVLLPTIFLFNFIIPLSLAIYQPFTTCSTTTFSCGSITGIGYPFWGLGRPAFCAGRPEFQLFCPNGYSSPAIELGTLPYKVLAVNSSTQTLALSQQVFSFTNSTCPPLLFNTTLNQTLFAYDPLYDVVNLTVLYGCRAPQVESEAVSSFACWENGTRSTALVYEGEGEVTGGCESRVQVLVFSGALERMKKGEETMLGMLNEGFVVKYKMNATACSACEASGGACGSSPELSSEFKCFCRDGAYPYQCPGKKINNTTKIAGISVGAGILGSFIVIAAIFLFYTRRYKKHSESPAAASVMQFKNLPSNPSTALSSFEGGSTYKGVSMFNYDQLEEATNYFDPSKELGEGGFGTVYHGKLKDGREVAIKRLFENNSKRVQQFMNEIEILARLRHRNLVALYGCTPPHAKDLLLVYDYVPNGTVSDHLHTRRHFSPLPWPARLGVASETAAALVYLHASDIIHRDVKTTNILLDDNLTVKVADFGLSRLFPLDATHVSTAPQGTPGYVDPEYHQCYQLTDKSDVYSFGVVLAELISAKPAVDITRHRHEINLSNMAVGKIQNDTLHEFVDESIGFKDDEKVREEVTAVAELAFRCLQHERDMRPAMQEVFEVLTRIQQGSDKKTKQVDETTFVLESHETASDSSTVTSPGSKEKSHSICTPTPDSSC